MPSLNKVMLIGNLTRDPQQRSLPSGMLLSQFGLACNRRWKTQTGEDKEETCFVDIEAWGQQADFVGRNLGKGSPVYVEGRLRMDSWQDKTTGQNRSRLVVVADYVQALERRNQMMGGMPDDYQ
ncbi:MAG: single-stranded DNA-binding protein, partial [Victivallales bacterium]|nr:single-stranded DNA-binding protein [Victivallales bacterium]